MNPTISGTVDGEMAPGRTDDPPRAVVLIQPEASLVAAGMMRTIRRSIGTDYRGRLYIYASRLYLTFNRKVCNTEPYLSALKELGYKRGTLPLQRFVGHAVLGECRCINPADDVVESIDVGPYRIMYGKASRLLYDWHFVGSRYLESPIPLPEKPGELPGLFRIDPELAARVIVAAGPRGTGLDLGPPRGPILEYGFELLKR